MPRTRPIAAALVLAATVTWATSLPSAADDVDNHQRCEVQGPLPYAMTGHSARLFAAPRGSAAVVGVLYQGHRMSTGRSTPAGWVEVTDRTTGVHGWTAPGSLARPARLCLG